ncbi:MAG: nucleotidyltransferase domain-containing protein [Ferroplasma sp.]|uniref:nucleotidyltransferase domain-containing protein n=1 Tax=Ferroplasma sp. TaxID=2591003 RepID=UPI00281698EF|nr:nucleotidyltransferase domain-containing protein [Ferroplasma sp.]WMT50499.1 MAG: nucleotidyltransferase domain-containing protein [Ferroplasma sp.]
MQRKYLNSAPKIYELDYKLIIKKLEEYGNRCTNKGAVLAILIGSLAKGNYSPFSDADVIIITEGKKNVIDFMEPSFPVDVEPRVYTLDEVYALSIEKKKIILEIIQNGIILSGKQSIMENIRKLYYSNS